MILIIDFKKSKNYDNIFNYILNNWKKLILPNENKIYHVIGQLFLSPFV